MSSRGIKMALPANIELFKEALEVKTLKKSVKYVQC